jgi:hypothetical protein
MSTTRHISRSDVTIVISPRIEFLGSTSILKGLPFHKPVLSTRTVPLVDFVYGLNVFNAII